MVQKKFAIPAIGAVALVAGGVAANRLVRRWAENPDPLDGEPLTFPDGAQRTVELPDGATINTIHAGTGPTIVCVHGLTSNHLDWAPLAPLLIDAGYSVLAIEQRGHGDSTPGAAGYGSRQLGDDLARVFEQLDIDAVALVGHSMGGMAAMSYAVHEPEAFHRRVEALVLVATAASLRTVRHTLGLLIGGLPIPSGLRPPDDRMRVSAGLGAFGARPSLHMIDQAVSQFGRCQEPVRAAATAALREHDVDDLLYRIDAPTLVVGGSRDQLIRPEQVRRLAQGIEGARVEMYRGAGHMVIWERRRELAELLIGWLPQPVATGRSSSEDQPDHDPV